MRKWISPLFACFALTLAAHAADVNHPGFLDFRAMGFFDDQEPTVDINLDGPLLKLLSGISATEEPQVGELIGQLESVRVHVLQPKPQQAARLAAQIDELTGLMGKSGWERVVRVRDEGDHVDLYIQSDGDSISGVTVFVQGKDDESVFVNVAGHFSMDSLVGLAELGDIEVGGKNLDLGDLSKIQRVMREKSGN